MKLVVLEGPAARPSFEIRQSMTLIGRAPDCDVLVFDAQVSRHHAQVLLLGTEYHVQGLQPSNPVIVNDQVITGRRRLVDGDLIVLGGVVLEVDIPPATRPAAHSMQIPLAGSPAARPAVSPSARPPSRPAASPDARPVATPAAPPVAPPVEERRPLRPPALPPPPPREVLRTIATTLAEASQRLQARAEATPATSQVSAADAPAVEAIVREHERLGGDAELARVAGLLSDRLTNQTDIRALYRLSAEAAVLVAWTKAAQRSIAEAIHLAEVLGVH